VKKYLSITNFRRAAGIGGLAGLMALPRILEGGGPVISRVVAVFPAMILAAGAATAWGDTGGLCGVLPDRDRVRRMVLIAAVMGVVLLPLQFWVDAGLAEALIGSEDTAMLSLAFPGSVASCLSLILWGAGFETLFFKAATMSFVARVTRRQWAAVMCAVIFGMAVGWLKLDAAGVDLGPMGNVRLAAIGLVSVLGCVLYARGGLPAAMVFVAVLDVRHLLRLALS